MKAKGEKPWLDFICERKAHGQGIITKTERDAAPDRQLYIYYTAGGGTHRSINVDDVWSYSWAAFKGVFNLPSNESYFSHINSGWTGPQDMLTMILNAASLEIADGRPLSYNWLSGGWEGEPGHSHGDIVRWRGFLKCYYTAGMIGGNAGYYQYLGRDGFSQPFPADHPPHWLQQITTVAQVHAAMATCCRARRTIASRKTRPLLNSRRATKTCACSPASTASARSGSSPRGSRTAMRGKSPFKSPSWARSNYTLARMEQCISRASELAGI